MRKAFVNSIEEVFEENNRAVLLIGDIGAYLVRNIQEKYPKRVLNLGIAEANMMGIAVGMALEGWVPFVYTITPFITSRCFDQIRVGVGYHEANVKIIGVGSGISYSTLGSTHHSIEDISLMRSVPGMTIISPMDSAEATAAILVAATHLGPVYVRLTLNVDPYFSGIVGQTFSLGKATVLKEGSDIALISTGEITREVLIATDLLEDKFGISVCVINMSTIKPLDTNIINKSIREAKAIFTIEEHSVLGGLGSAVSEVIAESKVQEKPLFLRIGLEDSYVRKYGSRSQLLQYAGLDGNSIYGKISLEIKHLFKEN